MSARCVVCGRRPIEDCCPRCHEVHERLWTEVYDPPAAYPQKARYPERPLCKCHGEPMWSLADRWQCRIRQGASPGTFGDSDQFRVDNRTPVR